MSSDEGAAEGGQAATTAPTQASLAGDLAVASVVDDAVAQPQPQQLPTTAVQLYSSYYVPVVL